MEPDEINSAINFLNEHSQIFKESKKSIESKVDVSYTSKSPEEVNKSEGWAGQALIKIHTKDENGKTIIRDIKSYAKSGGDGSDITGFSLEIQVNKELSTYSTAVSINHELNVHANKFADVIAGEVSIQEKFQQLASQSPAVHHRDLSDKNSTYNKVNAQILEGLKSANDFKNSEPLTRGVGSGINARLDSGDKNVSAPNLSSYNVMVNILNSVEGDSINTGDKPISDIMSGMWEYSKMNFSSKLENSNILEDNSQVPSSITSMLERLNAFNTTR